MLLSLAGPSDTVEMSVDVGVFCVIELAASERKLFVVYDDRGLLALVLVPRELNVCLWSRACCCIACCQSCTVCRKVVFSV